MESASKQPDPAAITPAVDGKSPLASKTLGLALIGFLAGAVGKKWPEVGDFLRDNSSDILMYGSLAIAAFQKSRKPIDWSNWTLFGVGKKF